MTDLGVITNYLVGISVNYDRQKRTMELSQSKYIESLAEKYHVANMRTFRTPMEKNLELPYSVVCDNSVSDYRKLINRRFTFYWYRDET